MKSARIIMMMELYLQYLLVEKQLQAVRVLLLEGDEISAQNQRGCKNGPDGVVAPVFSQCHPTCQPVSERGESGNRVR